MQGGSTFFNRRLVSRGWLLLTLALVVASWPACSFLIDVEPDCHLVSNCTPYACNSENTSCLGECQDNSHCAPGFVCIRAEGRCVFQGCQPRGEPLALYELTGTGYQYDVARFEDGYALLVTSSQGVDLVLLTNEGGVKQDYPRRLEDATYAPVSPSVVATNTGSSLFWRGVSSDGLELIRHHRLISAEQQIGPNLLYQGRFDQAVTSPCAAQIAERIVLAWSTVDRRSQVQALSLNRDGTHGNQELTAPNEAARIISALESGSSQPALAATNTLGAVAYRETVSGVSSVALTFFTPRDLQLVDTMLVSDGPVSAVESIVAAGRDERVASAWIEVKDGERLLMRIVASTDDQLLQATPSQDLTRNPRAPHLISGAGEFALAWLGESDGSTDVYMARYDQSGNLLFRVFPLAQGLVNQPQSPKLVEISDGYAAFWVEGQGATSQLMLLRLRCNR